MSTRVKSQKRERQENLDLLRSVRTCTEYGSGEGPEIKSFLKGSKGQIYSLRGEGSRGG